MKMLSPLASQYLQALLAGDEDAAWTVVSGAVSRGAAMSDIYLGLFQETQREVGRLWEINQLTVAREHYCTAVTQSFMNRLFPMWPPRSRRNLTAVVACGPGDLHEIGARMVADFLEMDGWDVAFAGSAAPEDEAARQARDRRARLVCLTYTIRKPAEAILAVTRGIRDACGSGQPRILVGGAAINADPDLWRQAGADGSAPDAMGAVMAARRLQPA